MGRTWTGWVGVDICYFLDPLQMTDTLEKCYNGARVCFGIFKNPLETRGRSGKKKENINSHHIHFPVAECTDYPKAIQHTNPSTKTLPKRPDVKWHDTQHELYYCSLMSYLLVVLVHIEDDGK